MKSRILLIDDSLTIHRVIDLCVDKEKYDVVKVFTKEDAFTALAGGCPDLVLLDNKLTDSTVADMVAMVKESCPNCFVILLAGAFDHFDKEQCVAVGADDFIFKPFDAKTLESRILCGLEGVCDETDSPVQPDLTEEEVKGLMSDMTEEVDIPPFEEETELPAGLFDGLKEADEDELQKEAEVVTPESLIDDTFEEESEIEEPVAEDAAEDEPETADFDMAEPEIAEPVAEPAPQSDGGSGVEVDFDFDTLVIPDEPELDGGNPFDGLVEADELSVLQKEETPAATDESMEPTDELDNLLDGINEESEPEPEIMDAIGDVEEALAEDAEELAEMAQNEGVAQMVLEEIDEIDTSDNSFEGLFAVDETEEKAEEPKIETEIDGEIEIPDDIEIPEDLEIPDEIDGLIQETAQELMPHIEADDFALPESEVDEAIIEESADFEEEEIAEEETADEDTEDAFIPELGEEELREEMPVVSDSVPRVSISHEKLVEAVFEAIDEDTLKYAIKEVLTDKISRVLEEELPLLVERAIRKEIERLVKGN